MRSQHLCNGDISTCLPTIRMKRLIILFSILFYYCFVPHVTAQDSITMPITKAAIKAFAHDPSVPKVIINARHVMWSASHSFSCDHKYLITHNVNSIQVWDRTNMRIIKTFRFSGVKMAAAHPTDPDLILVDVDESAYQNKKVTWFFGEPLLVINWKTGKVIGHYMELNDRNNIRNILDEKKIDENDSSKDLLLGNQIKANPEIMLAKQDWYGYYPLRQTKRFIGNGLRIMPCGSIRSNRNDSLLLISAAYPMIWDIKGMRLVSFIPYYDYLKENAPALDFPTSGSAPILPKPKSWNMDDPHAPNGHARHFEAYFTNHETVIMGGATPYITEWDYNRQKMIKSIRVPQKNGAVLDFKDYKGKRMIIAHDGLFYGPLDGPYKRLEDFNQSTTAMPIGLERHHRLFLNMPMRLSTPFNNGNFLVAMGPGQLPGLILGNYSGRKLTRDFGEVKIKETDDFYDLKISENEDYALGITGDNVYVIDLKDATHPRIQPPLIKPFSAPEACYCCAILPDGRYLVGTAFGNIYSYSPTTREWDKMSAIHTGRVTSMNLSNNRKWLFSVDEGGTAVIWNSMTLEPIVSIYLLPPSGYLCVTPDNYYTYREIMTPLSEFAHISKDNKTFSYDQFDLSRNRPDIILERLGGDKETVNLLHQAWLRRVRREGMNPEMLHDDYHVPTVEFKNKKSVPVTTIDRKIKLKIEAEDTQEGLSKIVLYVNGVPQTSKTFMAQGEKSVNIEFDVDLVTGENNISVIATNTKGARSITEGLSVTRRPAPNEKEQRRLWIVAAGVSDYLTSGNNLKYAAKDASDFAQAMSEASNSFTEIKTLVLINKDFTSLAIQKARKFLSNAQKDDAVILFFAGHGVLDTNLDYYLAPFDMDFSTPAAKGISMETFVGLLDDVAPLSRYVIVDACHSGGIYKTEFIAENKIKTDASSIGGIRFRSIGDIREKSQRGSQIRRLSQDLFSEISTAAGATVIASADGDQLAMESDQWGNGLFTYLIKEGLAVNSETNKPKALNNNNELTIEDLGKWVRREAAKISENTQTPNIKSSIAPPLIIYKNLQR